MENDNSLHYRALRDKYPFFIYEGYDALSKNGSSLDITYHFNIPGLARFDPTWSFVTISPIQTSVDCKCLDELIFSLGMVELVSYWKLCCPPIVRVEAGKLAASQVEWWKKLYRKGLGEYFYKNGIPQDDGLMDIVCPLPDPVTPLGKLRDSATDELSKILIPIGGGKDSAVTLELLRGFANRFGYIINPRQATNETAKNSGIRSENIIKAERILDKKMLALNAEGFLNGHTPFSAIVAFSSVLSGYINGLDYVVLSNESSANEATIANSNVNHQYSKSFEFEEDFRHYEREYINSGIEYFSLLRPLSELQIAWLFAQYKHYHAVFRSCNAASKRDEWCGTCPKCLFVFIMLSPFLDENELFLIFHKNLYDDLSLKGTLEQLVGFTPEKPFECVGRRDEVRAALEMVLERYNKEAKPLPQLLLYYKEKRDHAPFNVKDFFAFFDEENAVPQDFLKLVRYAAMEGFD